MSLLPFLAVTSVGALVALALHGRRHSGTLAGLGAVAASLLVLVVTTPGDPLLVGGGALALTEYARVLLGVALMGGLLVLVVSRLATWEPLGPATLLVAVAGSAAALGTAGAPIGLLAAGSAAALAATVALAQPATPLRVRALARELRGATAATTVGLVAVGLLPQGIGGLAAQPQVAGLAAVAAGVALGHRFGAIPLHARVARLSDAAPASTLPALLALLPAAWAVVLLGWAPDTLGQSAAAIGWDGRLLVLFGLTTLVLGAIAALMQDDILRIVAYSVVLDAGVVLLGFSSLDPAGREAVRAWLVPFVATTTALLGWAIAFRAAFSTSRLSEARGWLRRAPALGVALVGIGLAAVGWPGFLVWDARLAALQAATAGPALMMASLASLGLAVAVARILGAGLGRPEPRVTSASGELARVPAGLRAASRAFSAPGGRRAATVRLATHELRPLLEMNRTPLRALLVVILAGVALMSAIGAFGIREAAAGPEIPIPAPASPSPNLLPVATPGPDVPAPTDQAVPGPSGAPAPSVVPSGAPAPSAAPSDVPTPPAAPTP
jgi:NADH:ubiquinone oxidoreductase subunit 2 (subunit N)